MNTERSSLLPAITDVNQPFFDGCDRGELVLQHGTSTGRPWFPPRPQSPDTLAADFEWRAVSGRARLWSWIVMHQGYIKAFKDQLPYVVAYVELEEGPMLFCSLEGVDPEEIHCDMPLQAVFPVGPGDRRILSFRKADRDEH